MEKNQSSKIQPKTRQFLTQLFSQIINTEFYYFEFRTVLKENNRVFDVGKLWNILLNYSRNKVYLDIDEMTEFLDDVRLELSEDEIECVFNKLDWDKDDLINFDDLCREFEV